jgi:hypothetical protein
LKDADVDAQEELQKNPIATSSICPVDDCKNPLSTACENRFCEYAISIFSFSSPIIQFFFNRDCYKQFLCSLVWRNEIEPW